MSCIRASEIVQLVLTQWGVHIDDVGRPMSSDAAARARHEFKWSPDYEARGCAVLLIMRHTQAGRRAICDELGMKRQSDHCIKMIADRFDLHTKLSEPARRKVERIEDQIDHIHERRLALGETVVGIKGLRRPVHAALDDSHANR